jgi:hypothetical protein
LKMNRREFLKRCGLAGLTALSPRSVLATQPFSRRRPYDSDWPSPSAWKRLNDQVDGNLVPVEFPLDACIKDTNSVACQNLAANIRNPYFIGDQPGLTQTLGWVDTWFTKPSVFAVAAKNADHVAAAVDFARDNNLRLVIKGGGHSYQGTSNAPDSLLVWTRHMQDISMHEKFIPQFGNSRFFADHRLHLTYDYDLLKFAVEAHSGLSRWNQLNFVKADVSITGTI